jgi:hypothetical protein
VAVARVDEGPLAMVQKKIKEELEAGKLSDAKAGPRSRRETPRSEVSNVLLVQRGQGGTDEQEELQQH